MLLTADGSAKYRMGFNGGKAQPEAAAVFTAKGPAASWEETVLTGYAPTNARHHA